MAKEITKTDGTALDRVMYENLRDNLGDMKNSLKHRPFGSRINYYCYLLAMIRTVMDFSEIAEAEQNHRLMIVLDKTYQVVHDMLREANARFACFNIFAPFSHRAQIGRLYLYIRGVKNVLSPSKMTTGRESKEAGTHGKQRK